MGQFYLPNSEVLVTGQEVFGTQSIRQAQSPQSYENSEGTVPDWTLDGVQVPSTLGSPMVYAIIEDGEINVHSEVWIKQSAIPSLSVVVFLGDTEDKFNVVVCHSDAGVPPDEIDESYEINFSIPMDNLEGRTSLELFLFREDPKTSRGTVTTVQHEKDETVNQTK